MEELTLIPNSDRKTQYRSLLPQIRALITDEPDLIANLANICAVLKTAFDFLWVGFYLVRADELVLGPFQGPIACTRIKKGKGVCGMVWETGKPLLVSDVNQFPGHIACSSESRSEIVVPLTKNSQVIGVLDIDSSRLNDFNNIDQKYLTAIIDLL